MTDLMKLPSKEGKQRIVIVGGGFGGISLAKSLQNSSYQVVLIDKQNYHTFQPLLYQVATAGLESHSVVDTLRDIIRSRNVFIKMAEAQSVSTEEKVVRTNLGNIFYDYLVLANGAVPNFFGNDNLKKNAFTLKSSQDAIKLREHLFSTFELASTIVDEDKLASLLNVVIVGGGPTGVELAGAIAELREHILTEEYKLFDSRKMNIYLVEGVDSLLNHMSDFSSQRALDDLRAMGVEIKLNTFVEDTTDEVVTFSDGFELSTHTLIWAAGVKGNVIEGFRKSTIEKSQLKVNHQLKVKGEEAVFAIGDIALFEDEKYPQGLPMLAPVAIQQGEFLGKLFKNKLSSNEVFEYTNKGTMATIGRNKAVVELPFGKPFGGFFAWFIWAFVHIMSIVGLKNRLVVFLSWTWNYFTFRRSNQYIFHREKAVEEKGKALETT